MSLITTSIKSLVKKGKLKLFKKELIFFGLQAYKFRWNFVDPGNENEEAWVCFEKDDPSELNAGGINFNTNILNKKSYTYNNFCFVLCHELLHILNKHGLRKSTRNHQIWCVACDHIVETELKKMSSIIQPWEGRYNIVQRLTDELGDKITTEQAYKWLHKNEKFINISQNPTTGQIEVKDQHDNLLHTVSPQQGGDTDDNKPDPELAGNIEQFVSEARAIFNDMKNKASISGGICEYLSELLKVEIPWEELVEKAIKTNVVMKQDDRSWRSLNKYFAPHGITLPGYSLMEDTDGVGTLIIGLDSSGSVNKKQLKEFSYIIERSMHYFKEIKLIVHDIQVHQEKTFNKENILEFYTFLSNEGYKGRGGTSHKHLFNKVEEMFDENPDDISLVISLTDNYSDVSHIYKNYNWIKNNLPLVIVITSDGREEQYDENFGDIKQIKIK